MARPDLYRCEQCGRLFLMDFDPTILCAAHGEGEHCHTGEQEWTPDGIRYAIPEPDCIPFATTEWKE